MNIRNWLRSTLRINFCAALSVGLIAGTVVAAQTSDASPTNSPRLYSRADGGVRIGIGDMLQVDVFDTPELSAKLRVDNDGAVDLPVGGAAEVVGLTPKDAADAVARRLREAQIMTDPRVTITIADYATQEISVLGEVRNPGNYLLLGPHSLYNALSAAGGTNDKAGGDIVITHAADPQNPETVRVSSADFSRLERTTNVSAGDVIFVSRAGSVYVLGDVSKPGEFPIIGGTRITVLEALALAQGTNPNAALTHAVIIRKSEDGSKIIPIDIKRMTEKAEGNQILYAEDIVVVPKNRGRAFLDATLPGLTGSVAGSAIAAILLSR